MPLLEFIVGITIGSIIGYLIKRYKTDIALKKCYVCHIRIGNTRGWIKQNKDLYHYDCWDKVVNDPAKERVCTS